MPHRKLIKDKDPCFVIDANTRTIKKQTVNRKTLMQYDHNSERFSFLIPKSIEGHDMMECNKVEVHYINIDALTMEQFSGVYTVTDLQTDTEDAAMLKCSWLISQNATKLSGSLNFLLRFACVAEDGTIEYAWNTEIFTGISVTSGIYNSEVIVEQYADVLEQWKKELENSGSGGSTVAYKEVKYNDLDNIIEAGIYKVVQDESTKGDGYWLVVSRSSDPLEEPPVLYVIQYLFSSARDRIETRERNCFTEEWDEWSYIGSGGGGLSENEVKTLINSAIAGKANESTTLSGYGITDAYTKAEVQNYLGYKANASDLYNVQHNLLPEKADKTSILITSGTSLILTHNQEARLGEIATLTLSMPETIDDLYWSSFCFASGETATSISYSGEPIIWCGDDCDAEGSFIPEANTKYEVHIKKLGSDIVARVGAYA